MQCRLLRRPDGGAVRLPAGPLGTGAASCSTTGRIHLPHLGKFIYLLDKRRGAYNPLRELSTHPDYEEEMLDIFELLLARCAQNFERLPCVEDADLLRNILYSGVWLKYNCKNAKRTGKPDVS